MRRMTGDGPTNAGRDNPDAAEARALEVAVGLRAGDRRALARALSWAENRDPRGERVLREVVTGPRRAQVIGVTGSPGVGKSTLVDRLTVRFRQEGATVGVIAVDPSSPFSGGAILGDRIRMAEGSMDRGVFVRSLATRGRVGGLSAATGDAIRLMDSFGKDVVLVETVGAGQAEVEVMSLADTVLVVLAPGLGDDVQAIKAGILEIADVYVVNKGDRPGADLTVRELRQMLTLGRPRSGLGHRGAPGADEGPDGSAWSVPVIRVSALGDEGFEPLVKAIRAHRIALDATGLLGERHREEADHALRDRLADRYLADLKAVLGPAQWEEAVARIAQGDITVQDAVGELLAARPAVHHGPVCP